MSPPAATDVGMPEMKKNGTTQKPAADTDSVNGFKHAPQKPLPDFKDLPRVAGMPPTCAWGLFDTLSSSQPDEIGTLNLLTPERKVRARQEIQHGISVAITWSLDNCETPHSGRMRPEHRIKRLPDWVGHDDEIRMNTQSGSQWDGLRHWAHQLTGCSITESSSKTSWARNLPYEMGLINGLSTAVSSVVGSYWTIFHGQNRKASTTRPLSDIPSPKRTSRQWQRGKGRTSKSATSCLCDLVS